MKEELKRQLKHEYLKLRNMEDSLSEDYSCGLSLASHIGGIGYEEQRAKVNEIISCLRAIDPLAPQLI